MALCRGLAMEGHKFRRFYANISRRTFTKLVVHSRGHLPSLISYLESRVDVCLFRSGLSPNFRAVKNLLRAGRVFVNGRLVRNAALLLKIGDLVLLLPYFEYQNSKALAPRIRDFVFH